MEPTKSDEPHNDLSTGLKNNFTDEYNESDSSESSSNESDSSESSSSESSSKSDDECTKKKKFMNKMKNFKFEEPDEITDIQQHNLPHEELTVFLEKLKELPLEGINLLFEDVASKNNINPNDNRYSSLSKKNLFSYQFKHYMQEKKNIDKDNND